MPQLPLSGLFMVSAIAGILSASVVVSTLTEAPAAMYVTPATGTIEIDEPLKVAIFVRADTPVNVFKGILRFEPEHLRVSSIDYNTSIADLWAEEPWYENGDGTLSFIGGTTQPGGFTGNDSLITVTFESLAPGDAEITLADVRILKHDGLGTEAELAVPIDALFTITEEELDKQTIATAAVSDPRITILAAGRSTDLNGDNLQTIADISIFMRHLATQNNRSDFNSDGVVSAKDLSIILNP